MNVKEAMSKNPEYLPPDATLQNAAKEMQENDFGFLPIGENDRLVGVITDRDITIRAIANGKDPSKTQVKDFMTQEVYYCYEDDDIQKASEYMSKLQIKRLVVLNKDKRMTGILSLADLATKSRDEELIGHVVEQISETRH